MCCWLPVTLSPGNYNCLYYLDYGKINKINNKDKYSGVKSSSSLKTKKQNQLKQM